MIALLMSAMAFGALSITQTRSKSQKTKIKTIAGYFCGGDYLGQLFAYRLLRTPHGVMSFNYLFKRGVSNDLGENTPFYGVNKKGAGEIGSEYIVKYFTNNEGEHDAANFTFTGKVKKVKPCSVDR